MSESAAPGSSVGRIDAVDAIRGWAILLVVAGHAIQWTTNGFDDNRLFQLIYSFHMPLFFFISGVVSVRAVHRPLPSLIRSRSLGLLLPFASWWVLTNIAQALRGGYSLPDALAALYRSPDAGLWFLWVLFVVSILTALALRLAPDALAWITLAGVVALLWIARIPVLGMELVAWYFPFFAAGVLTSRPLIEGWASDRRIPALVALAVAAAWLALALGWRHADLVWPAQQWAVAGYPLPRIIDLAYRYLVAMLGTAASLAIVPRVPLPRSARAALLYLGRHTLEVYVGHILLLTLLARAGLMNAAVAGVLALGGSLALAVVLKRVRLLRVALYGGRD